MILAVSNPVDATGTPEGPRANRAVALLKPSGRQINAKDAKVWVDPAEVLVKEAWR